MILVTVSMQSATRAFGQGSGSTPTSVTINIQTKPTAVMYGDRITFTWMVDGVTNFNGGHTNLLCHSNDAQFTEDQWLHSTAQSAWIYSVQSSYSGSIDARPWSGTLMEYKCRVLVMVGSQNFWSDIYTVEVLAPKIVLDPLPSTYMVAGDFLTISGRVVDPVTQAGISGVTVQLGEKNQLVQIFLPYQITDSQGNFRIRWQTHSEALSPHVENIYAFSIEQPKIPVRIESNVYPVTVYSSLILTLTDLNKKIYAPGEAVTFQGRLTTLDGLPVSGRPIQIKDAGPDIEQETDMNGNFVASWRVPPPPADDIVYAPHAFYTNNVTSSQSLYTQFAVVRTDAVYDQVQFVECNLFSDTPFQYKDSDQHQVTAKGILGNAAIILKSGSKTVSAGDSFTVPFKAEPGWLTLNIRNSDDTVSSIALRTGTPLLKAGIPLPIAGGWSVEGTLAYGADITLPAGTKATIDSTHLEYSKWGQVDNVHVDVYNTAVSGDTIPVILKSRYGVDAALKQNDSNVLSVTLLSRECSPDMRYSFDVTSPPISGVSTSTSLQQPTSSTTTNSGNPTPTLNVQSDRLSYAAGDVATIAVVLGVPNQEVLVHITNPAGNDFASRTVSTDAQGNASFQVAVQDNYPTGSYGIVASSTVNGYYLQSKAGFTVFQKTAEVAQLHSINRSVNIDGNSIGVQIDTSSTVSALSFEKEQKMLSFMVSGKEGTQGTTIIPIGKVLRGPYIVMIDGVRTQNYQIMKDDDNVGDPGASMKIWYGSSRHAITILGTNIVPEFPVASLGAVATVIGAIAILGRTRLFKPL